MTRLVLMKLADIVEYQMKSNITEWVEIQYILYIYIFYPEKDCVYKLEIIQ